MKEETFKKAEKLRSGIFYYKETIKDTERFIKIRTPVIRFHHPDVSFPDVTFYEDESFIKTALKIALLEFKEKLCSLEKELEEL